MSAWPSLDRTADERLARALRDGEPAALSQLSDRYAARLFDYCHALLRDQDEASRALRDALLAIWAHGELLHERNPLRPFVYTLVRNECLRRLRSPDRPAERHEAPEVEDAFLDAAEHARRLETRRLVHSALAGLRGRERETLDLLLRHDLDTDEIAAVLGLPPGDAAGLADEAVARLDESLAAAMIAHAGREDCPSVAALADDGDGPLSPSVARKLARHIEHCPVCSERRERTVSSRRLMQVLPVALLPSDLPAAVIAAASDPDRMDELEALAARANTFDEEGRPLPVDGTGPGPAERPERRGTPPLWPALAAAAAVLVVVTGAYFLMPGRAQPTAGGGTPSTSASVAAPSEDPLTDEPAEPSETPSPTPTPTTSSATPTPTATPTRRTRTPRPSRTVKPPPPPSSSRPGTLAVSGCSMGAGSSCTVTVRAVGGTVRWSVAGTSGVSAAGGGTLLAGQSAGVSATRTGECSGAGGGSVSFAPGGAASVTWNCPPEEPEEPEPDAP
ncbi:sigma-70 family RNA polymerase sigma factor [Actinomadura flavalba]|uniref:sigma-70 family RNA polymerase sigma factor n=1 Tax=Actinomadura flavalba TaxID=1120938 RepID=UPI00036E85B4|nr:sigma-70 family RNA polymerase sigma factor [Actinomadura flavalba]